MMRKLTLTKINANFYNFYNKVYMLKYLQIKKFLQCEIGQEHRFLWHDLQLNCTGT